MAVINGKPFNPGEMRTQIYLDQRVTTDDAGGFQIQSWVEIVCVKSKWINAHGREVWEAAAAHALAPATVTIRFRSDIEETWSVRKDGIRYEIVSMDNIQDRDELIEMKVKLLKDT
jgi:SPP1 family predicted phage head-tail adaptor